VTSHVNPGQVRLPVDYIISSTRPLKGWKYCQIDIIGDLKQLNKLVCNFISSSLASRKQPLMARLFKQPSTCRRAAHTIYLTPNHREYGYEGLRIRATVDLTTYRIRPAATSKSSYLLNSISINPLRFNCRR